MKIRSTAAVIAAITAAAMITACGAKKPKAGSPADAANTARTVAEDVVAAGSGGGGISADADAEKNRPDAGTVSGGGSADDPAPAPSSPAVTGEERPLKNEDRNVVLADNNECRVTVTGCNGDQEEGYEVKLLFENKDMAADCLFAVERAYLDGVQFDTYFAGTAAPGKSMDAYVTFSADEMKKYGIKNPTDIALYMSAIDPDYYNGDHIDETCHIYPGGYGRASSYKYTVRDEDKILAENKNAAIILTGFSRDSELDYFCADLCLVNKTKEALVFTAEDVTVNGEDLYPYFSHTLDGGCTAFTKIMWPGEDIADLEPARPENIKAVFIVNTEKGEDEKMKKECVLMP